MERRTTFDTATADPVDVSKLMLGLVVPRPIGWVGSVDEDGRHNLAPFSFYNVVSAKPPTVVFSPGTRRGAEKDTLANVRRTGEFTLSVVTEEVADAMVLTSGDYPPDVDEFEIAGLTARRGDAVAAPLVAEARAVLECEVTQVVDVGDPPANSVVFGRVLRIHVDPQVLDGTRVRPEELKAVGRMAGDGYTTTAGSLFSRTRPR
jgi:flavin reductase (DIM6/NTAB) family NADH-FMN oxidoreductase RutF